jgi:phage tail sheath protein FI
MAVFLSPGVFPREIDLSTLPAGVGPLRPGFIGTAKKGPMNTPVLITNAANYVDTFGDPFPESYLGMRVGIECELGQPAALEEICVDTSGARGSGWGRVPIFTGIDFGRISLRQVGNGTGDNPEPLVFHDASIDNIDYNDVDSSATFGDTTATLEVLGGYTGAVDDSFVMVITSPPDVSSAAPVDGAEYEIVRNSDGEIVATGTLSDGNDDGTSLWIPVGDAGFSVRVVVSAGVLDTNDTFTWTVQPNNRDFSVAVDGGPDNVYTMPIATYTDAASFVAAANALLVGEDYIFIEFTLDDGTTIPQLRTDISGERIQIMTTQGWALEVGSQQYAWDIPRSFLLGLDPGPYTTTTQNNRVKIEVIGNLATQTVEFSIPSGTNLPTSAYAPVVDAAGIVSGDVLWDSFELSVPGGATHLVIQTTDDHKFDTLKMLTNFSNLKTLRFAEEFNFPFPYSRSYRGYDDNRTTLPDPGASNPATPLSCETNPLSAQCATDTAYFQNIVGWLVAPSPGTWVDDYTVNLNLFTEGPNDAAGRYSLSVIGSQGEVLETVSDISFDKREDRYIGNVVNAGSRFGGTRGNLYVNWEERPAFLENDVFDAANFVVRLPSQFNGRLYLGAANGIPNDPAYSSELDAAVIGSPALSTGLYAFQNPESIDISLLATPGFSTGAVIGTALQVAESRGDVLYIVDPPFGLRPQQTVDWHNGMLLSDLNTAINSSYGALYWGWLRIFDQFSREEIWVPPSGHVSAVFSRTARDAEQWFAPAGLRRGRILSALDVEYSPTQGERDLLYGSGNAVNPLVRFPNEGIVVWGQRTLQRQDTALDRVNVRMLLSTLKKNLTQSLRQFIFEPNDRILWRQVEATLDPFLADIQSRRGMNAYRIVVDETNNTPDRIDRNELWVSVFVQPTRTVEFVVLNLVVLRTGASFSAEEVLAAGGIVQ